jgi:hypothetical protein
MWKTSAVCNFKGDLDCDPYGYMGTEEIEHQEVFNVSNAKDFKIGFINIFKLTKY